MAKIKDYELRDYKMYTTHRGVGFNAKLYKGLIKIGDAYDEGIGGGIVVHIYEREEIEPYRVFVQRRYGDPGDEEMSYMAEQNFIHELEMLTTLEHDFKIAVMSGDVGIAYLEDKDIQAQGFKFPMSVNLKPGYNKKLLNQMGYKKVTVFESLDDFNLR